MAIISVNNLTNRMQRNAFRNEAVRIAKELQPVIDNFEHALFNSPNQFSYGVIYQHFHQEWKDACEKILKSKPRLKVTIIEKDFFAKEYAPENRNKKI